MLVPPKPWLHVQLPALPLYPVMVAQSSAAIDRHTHRTHRTSSFWEQDMT